MAERPAVRRRVFIEDARRNGMYLRTTWHPEAGQFVISTWSDEVCTGAVRVPAAEAAELIGLFADGLADAATAPAPPAPSTRPGLADRVRGWLRQLRRSQASVAAEVVELPWRKSA
jgi:hypothetical protein